MIIPEFSRYSDDDEEDDDADGDADWRLEHGDLQKPVKRN